MAWERPIMDLPAAVAGSDFSTGNGYSSTGQFLFCKVLGTGTPQGTATDNTFTPCTNIYDIPIGVSQTNPKSGDALQLRVEGVSKVLAGGTIKAGDMVGTDANGKAVTKTPTATGANIGEFVRGIALEGASSGQLCTVYLGPFFQV